jgi:PII-like signaling protein
MVARKMVALAIRIKKNDEFEGKRLERVLLDFFAEFGISGAAVWAGVDGFGKRGRSKVQIEGITVNMPLLIEVVDERQRIEPLLAEIKRMVGDNGLVTLHDVDVL